MSDQASDTPRRGGDAPGDRADDAGRSRASGRGLRCTFATSAHEPELRRLLRQNAMPGALSLTLEREPHFALAAGVEGDVHDTVVCLDAEGAVCAMGGRAERDAFVAGVPGRMAYLAQLRVDAGHRGGRRFLERAFALLRERHDAAGRPLTVTTIVEDNTAARRLLTSGRLDLPRYVEAGRLRTWLLPTRHTPAPRAPPGVALRDGTAADLAQVAECLARSAARCRFAPRWTADTLAHPALARGLAPSDFTVALRAGAVVGCAALWDQRAFKQAVVRRYGGRWRLARPLLNALAAPLGLLPRLPRVGTPLRQAFLSHVAADGHAWEVLEPLVAATLRKAHQRGLDGALLGLCDGHPAAPRVRRTFRHLEYRSIVYEVDWGHEAPASSRFASPAHRAAHPHLELACL